MTLQHAMKFFADKLSDAAPAASILEATTDVALITDPDGAILDLHTRNEALDKAIGSSWEGLSFQELVTVESRDKIDTLLEEAGTEPHSRWRQVNHLAGGQMYPVRYCVIALPDSNRLLFVGQDLGAMARLQQQLLEAQNATERDYWQIRQAEAKFRVLFQSSPDAILITAAGSQEVLDLNPAAQQLVGTSLEHGGGEVASGSGIPLRQYFHSSSQEALASLLAKSELSGEALGRDLALASGTTVSQTQIAMLRQGDNALHIVRLRLVQPLPDPRLGRQHVRALEHFEQSADAMVITNRNGQILAANHTFTDLAQIVNVEQAVGVALSNWLGQAQVDLNLLLANLRKHGRVRRFTAVVTGSLGVDADVEISATRLFSDEDEEAVYGFVIRDVSLRPNTGPAAEGTSNVSRSVEELTQLVGRVPLKELVRESADIIERLSIEAALKLTGDNRAAAAEMLGLSRQSLYVKLRRYELGDLKSDDT
ncbi:MAG: transcriptional regulator PpsR [Pseudomonadota bacterium]